ncbi:MAG: hypothetical protein H5U29_08630 [Pusillimonas sp.]|nr:hypothetical protein [Pusillimonas sp.]
MSTNPVSTSAKLLSIEGWSSRSYRTAALGVSGTALRIVLARVHWQTGQTV